MDCPVCGHQNREGAAFCGGCGASLAPEMRCAHCGAANAPTHQFCDACGQPLDPAAASTPPTSPLPAGEAGHDVEGVAGRVRATTEAGPSASHQERPHPTPLPAGEGTAVSAAPASFVLGRYQMQKFLGEGAKKRVYLAHDSQLDRDVAFALLKSEGLDLEGLARIRREAQAMGRLGDHPHIVTVFDIGDENGQPYIVSQYMAGGSLQSLIERTQDHRLPLDQTLIIVDQICQALEHAHAHGVIHRDLKPGNVWLSAVPTAKGETDSMLPTPSGAAIQHSPPTTTAALGDFGLAMALDRSRLTQAGMMVGTVSYMPPEQATGAEVTARSDLYSLGAMLYEMVCGRPPFIGDESVAIIGQHLNTPPVVPSWHQPNCPPGLEALILRLLEKDPAKRPASAAEVRQLLTAIEQGHQGPGHEPGDGPRPAASPAGPLYQHTFVGRELEVRQLRAAFDAATSGQCALVMVVGEPGIGKTTLCEQIATYAAVRGGKTLVGHCYEEGSLSLPYLPFVEGLRSYVLGQEPDRLKEQLGTGAGEVARIVSEIRDRVAIELPPAGDPEDDRWRLFQAVTGFLRNAASVQPILLVLEDLHWADRGTLDLLLHAARNLQGARLLIVGTYRDVEVDRAHPLSSTLAELRRISDFGRILLRGLTVDDVQRMINALQGQEIRWSFAEAVHRQTEGNPLFVQEVLHYLAEEGLIVRKEGRWEGRWRETGEAPPEMSIPEGLRDVIGKRLSKLAPECNRLLSVAAVIGREFRLDVLEKVSSAPEAELFSAIRDATGTAILEERSSVGSVVTYRFSHAFFRQTLYEEMIAPERIRLHQRVARTLEEVYAGRWEEHAVELAEHFSYYSDSTELAKAVVYGEMAARRAMGVFAYRAAVGHLERCLRVQEILDPDDQARRCDLLLALGDALMPAGEPQRVFEEISEEALTLAEALDDHARASRACRIALLALNRYAISFRQPRGPLRTWTERADRYALPGTADRVYADTSRLSLIGQTPERRPLALRSLELAGQLDDPQAYFFAARPFVTMPEAPKHHTERLPIIEEVLQRPRQGVNAGALAAILYSSGFLLFGAGERSRAEELWRELVELGDRTQDPYVIVYALAQEVHRAYYDGDLELALEKRTHLIARADESGSPSLLAHPFTDHVGFRGLLHLGRLTEAQALDHDMGSADPVYMALLGRKAEAEAALRERVAATVLDEAQGNDLRTGLEAAVLVGDQSTAEAILPWLAPSAGLALEYQNFPVSPGRTLAAAAAMLGRPEEARGYYKQALAVCEKVRFRPEVALIRLDLAELLLAHFPDAQSEARAHLDFAIKEFEAMKMQPSLERALSLKV